MIQFAQYMTCRITGAVRIAYFFPDRPDVPLVREFASKEESDSHIRDMQQGALNFILLEWVHHKRHIATHSTWYADATRKKALEGALRMAGDMVRWNLWQSCREVMSHKADLYAILPSPGNSSFRSSKEKLDEIIAFCEKTISKLQNKS